METRGIPELEKLQRIALDCQTPKEFLDLAEGSDLIFSASACREHFELTNEELHRLVKRWEKRGSGRVVDIVITLEGGLVKDIMTTEENRS